LTPITPDTNHTNHPAGSWYEYEHRYTPGLLPTDKALKKHLIKEWIETDSWFDKPVEVRLEVCRLTVAIARGYIAEGNIFEIDADGKLHLD